MSNAAFFLVAFGAAAGCAGLGGVLAMLVHVCRHERQVREHETAGKDLCKWLTANGDRIDILRDRLADIDTLLAKEIAARIEWQEKLCARDAESRDKICELIAAHNAVVDDRRRGDRQIAGFESSESEPADETAPNGEPL